MSGGLTQASGLSAAPPSVTKIGSSAIPFIIAPTGSMANNGALTLGTALPLIYANAFIYLPANAIQAGSAAGWYFCQMTSTTLGTVFNNTYVGPAVPAVPANPTPFVSVGPGAFTGVTIFVAGPSITLPANTMGPNAIMRETSLWSMLNNANAKTLAFVLGGVNIISASGASAGVVQQQSLISNRGAQNTQVSFAQNNNTGVGPANPTPLASAINFALSQVMSWGATPTVATDGIVLESYLVEVIPG